MKKKILIYLLAASICLYPMTAYANEPEPYGPDNIEDDEGEEDGEAAEDADDEESGEDGPSGSEQEEKVFEGWTDENIKSAWYVYCLTDWSQYEMRFNFGPGFTDDYGAIDLSTGVEDYRQTIKNVLNNSSVWTPSSKSSYVDLMLAILQVVSSGNPDSQDPYNVCRYFDKTSDASSMTKEKSIAFVFRKLVKCINAHNENEGWDANVKTADPELGACIEGLVLGVTYSRNVKSFTLSSAREYMLEHWEENGYDRTTAQTIELASTVLTYYKSMSAGSEGGGKIAAAGKQFVGCRYVWGGDRSGTLEGIRRGTDCSGFVYNLYKAVANISLGTSTYTQRYNGRHINSLSEAKPGDLLFFDGYSHVAIYCGNGMKVHAASTRSGVKYDSYFGGLCEIRRIIN